MKAKQKLIEENGWDLNLANSMTTLGWADLSATDQDLLNRENDSFSSLMARLEAEDPIFGGASNEEEGKGITPQQPKEPGEEYH